MKILKAYKFKLKTNESQSAMLRCFAGHCRFVWNKVLGEQKERLAQNLSCERYNTFAKKLPIWKKVEDLSRLSEAPSSALQQKLKDLDKALKDDCDKKQPNKKFPKFKKRGDGDSFRIPQASQFKVSGNRIFLPKIGWLRFFKSQEIEGQLKQVTVSQSTGHWYIAIQVEYEVSIHHNLTSGAIGIDMGVSKLFAASDGTIVEPVNSFKKYQDKLAKSQRKLSKKTKFSGGWKRQKRHIQKIHSKIANIRKDYLHKATTQFSKNHAMIVIEDLQVKNMSATAKGKNIKAKTGLNRSILDQGWFEARLQLTYKQKWHNGLLVVVPAHYTSQRCSKCGHTCKANRLSQSQFVCKKCHHTENADINAAKNILAAGHVVLAGGESALADFVKPEPLVA